MSKLKVLFHVNELDRWAVTLGNIFNLIRDVGKGGADIIVLANGFSISAYGDSDRVSIMEELAGQGVIFMVCRNSLKRMCAEGIICIAEEHLPPFVVVIPTGITEIIKKQHEGYAYVKP
jgi:uncharacterized protein